MAANHTGTRPRQRLQPLKLALREDWAARRFGVEYQPQVNLHSRKIVRFEALLRWKHAQGLISPKDFIPIAEEIGLISEMGQWVLEQACKDAMTWPEAIGIAVNVSPISLRDRDMPGMVRRTLSKSGLAASRLELEVTESSEIMMDVESLSVLNAIRMLGVRVIIDDLDAGHASLRYLLDFPFDKIKLDGIYASALDRCDRQGEAAREIMRSIAGLCRNLKIESLAEGVETPAQLALVMEACFTEVQGYIFGEPVSADNLQQSFRQTDEVWQTLAIAEPAPSAEFSFFQVADLVNDVIIVTTPEISYPGPKIIYVNPAFTRLTGFTAEEAIGKTPRITQGPGTSRKTLDAIRLALSEGRGVHEKILNYTKNGAPYWLDMRIEPLRDAAGVITHFFSIERDVTLEKRRLDELEYVADRDVLTGIPNRRAFMGAIDSEIALCRNMVGNAPDQRPLCIAWIDVDNFKHVNDSLGHAAGDAVLVDMAERLAQNIRRMDTIGRLGGEEFCVCMPAVTIADARSLATSLCNAVSGATIATPAGAVTITVSIGLAELAPADDAASLMARADAAMYEAKRAGGGRVRGA